MRASRRKRANQQVNRDALLAEAEGMGTTARELKIEKYLEALQIAESSRRAPTPVVSSSYYVEWWR